MGAVPYWHLSPLDSCAHCHVCCNIKMKRYVLSTVGARHDEMHEDTELRRKSRGMAMVSLMAAPKTSKRGLSVVMEFLK